MPTGVASIIQVPNSTGGASGKMIWKMRWNDRLGVVPTSVVTPPIEQAYAMPSMRATVKVRECSMPAVSSTWSTIASPMGTIITAVAVLAIHMERKAAATM